jgi:hypothetical protein
VITHQGWSRCASDAFARSIATQLPTGYRADDGGIFTDTANYTAIVPECSNLSVGYQNEHTKSETQSISHALALREAMLRIDVGQFACARDPAKKEYKHYDWGGSYYNEDFDWGRKNKHKGYSSGKYGFGSSVYGTGPTNVINGPWEAEWRYGDEVWVKRNGEWQILNDMVTAGPIQDRLIGAKRTWIKRDNEWRDEYEDEAYVASFHVGNEEEEGDYDPLSWQPKHRYEGEV